MARRTYLPELLKIMLRACTYMGKYEALIKEFLPSEHHNKFDAVLLACATLQAALKETIPVGV